MKLSEKLLVVIEDVLRINDPEKLLGYRIRNPHKQDSKRQDNVSKKQLQAREERKAEEDKRAELAAKKGGKKKK